MVPRGKLRYAVGERGMLLALPLERIQLVLVLLIVIVIGGGLGLSNSKSDGKSLNPIREIRAVSAGSRP